MEKGIFHSFQIIHKQKKKPKVLGWQYEMIYLGGDPQNPEEAIITFRTLEKAIVLRATDGKEETFCSVMIPYVSVTNVILVEKETGRQVAIGEKKRLSEVFETILLQYNDNGSIRTMRLKMSMAADMYQNSKLCRNLQEYVTGKIKKAL